MMMVKLAKSTRLQKRNCKKADEQSESLRVGEEWR